MNKFMYCKKALDTSTVNTAIDKIPSVQLPGTMATQSPFTSEKSTMYMTPTQWLSTLDPDFKKKYPYFAALNAVTSPSDYKLSLPYNLGNNISGTFNAYKKFADPILNSGPLLGGLYSVAPGALLGGLGTGVYNLFAGNDLMENMGRNTAIGGGIGGLIGAISGYYRKNEVPPSAPNSIDVLTPSQIDAVRAIEKSNINPAPTAATQP